METAYEELDTCTNDYIEVLDDEGDKDKIQELQDDMDSIYKELYDVKSTLISKRLVENSRKTRLFLRI